jgi:hypothetical protein
MSGESAWLRGINRLLFKHGTWSVKKGKYRRLQNPLQGIIVALGLLF